MKVLKIVLNTSKCLRFYSDHLLKVEMQHGLHIKKKKADYFEAKQALLVGPLIKAPILGRMSANSVSGRGLRTLHKNQQQV